MKLDDNLRHRRAIATWLESEIGWYNEGGGASDSSPSWLRYSFLVKDRDEFARRFRKRFDLAVWFTSVVHGRAANFEAVGYRAGSCPRAEHVAKHIVNFPTHPRISLDMLQGEFARHGAWVKENIARRKEIPIC